MLGRHCYPLHKASEIGNARLAAGADVCLLLPLGIPAAQMVHPSSERFGLLFLINLCFKRRRIDPFMPSTTLTLPRYPLVEPGISTFFGCWAVLGVLTPGDSFHSWSSQAGAHAAARGGHSASRWHSTAAQGWSLGDVVVPMRLRTGKISC